MEDFILIEEREQYQLYCVFDGHGGNHVSEFLKDHFCEVLDMELVKFPNNIELALE